MNWVFSGLHTVLFGKVVINGSQTLLCLTVQMSGRAGSGSREVQVEEEIVPCKMFVCAHAVWEGRAHRENTTALEWPRGSSTITTYYQIFKYSEIKEFLCNGFLRK